MAFLRKPDGSVISQFEHSILQIDSAVVRLNLVKAWEYAQGLDYHHPGQSKEIYLAHPLRVATLYLQMVRPAEEKGAMTGILHNALDVSSVRFDELTKTVGTEVANAIAMLTVDRERQWDNDYKSAYYEKIENGPEFVRRIKILDKLDNLFLLCLNPSDEIRDMYLNEVDRWLIPMTKTALPEITDYLCELVNHNRRSGHKPL